MVRGSASEAGGCGFDTRPRHTKDVNNGTSSYLDLRSAFIRRTLASLRPPPPPTPHNKIKKKRRNEMTLMIEYCKYVKMMVSGG